MEILLAIPGGVELAVVVGVIILLFGAAKIPTLMRSMGSGISEFKKGIKEGEKDAADDDKDGADKADPPEPEKK